VPREFVRDAEGWAVRVVTRDHQNISRSSACFFWGRGRVAARIGRAAARASSRFEATKRLGQVTLRRPGPAE